jgi:exodeoxyribonuclease VII small subunit
MNKKNSDFESKLKRLEEIVNKLESEDTAIEEALKLFEEGVEISKQLNEKLGEIKNKIEIISKDARGKIKLDEFQE